MSSSQENHNSKKRPISEKSINDRRNESAKWRDIAPVLKIFFTINPAYEFSKKHGMLPIFGLDKKPEEGGRQGAKKYVVASYQTFWNWYSHLAPEDRCCYETIIEGLASTLHIDAEFIKSTNPEADPIWIHETFCENLIEFALELGIIESKDQMDILILDSSNEKKFSKHYMAIIDGGNTRFKNNYHCGAFMRRFRNYMMQKYGMDTHENPFFLWGIKKNEKDNSNHLKNLEFVSDLAIYTMGRQWRVYGSTKRHGGYRPLFYEGEDKTKTVLDKPQFMRSLVQRIMDHTHIKLIECLEEDGSEPVSTSKKLLYRLDIMNMKKESSLSLPNVDIVSVDMPSKSKNGGSKRQSDAIPAIAKLIGSQIEKCCDYAGTLRCTYFNEDTKMLRFDSSSYYCAIKKGDHTNNHIWFKVYLRRKTYVQGCFCDKISCRDAKGRDYVTKEAPLPMFCYDEIDAFMKESSQKITQGQKWANALAKIMGFHSKIPLKAKF